MIQQYGAVEGGHQTLGRLAEHLTKKPAFEFEFTRVINAPCQRVYEAWTKPEQMAQWFAPTPELPKSACP